MKYQKDGWVRLLRDYGGAKKGDYCQIVEVMPNNLLHLSHNGKKIPGLGLWGTEAGSSTPECEWVGMEKPDNKLEWLPKIGDWIYAERGKDDCRDDKFVPVFRLEEISNQEHSIWLRPEKGKSGGVEIKNCRKALPHEIGAKLSEKDTSLAEEESFQVGDWVEIIKSKKNWNVCMDEYVGKIVQLSEKLSHNGFKIKEDGGKWTWVFSDGHFKRASRPEPQDKMEQLLAEAKRMYPVGTIYSMASMDEHTFTVEKQDFVIWGRDIRAEEGKGLLYQEGRGWAPIVAKKPFERVTPTDYKIPTSPLGLTKMDEALKDAWRFGERYGKQDDRIEELPEPQLVKRKEKKKRRILTVDCENPVGKSWDIW